MKNHRQTYALKTKAASLSIRILDAEKSNDPRLAELRSKLAALLSLISSRS